MTGTLPPTGANLGGVRTLVKLSPEAGAARALLCGERAWAASSPTEASCQAPARVERHLTGTDAEGQGGGKAGATGTGTHSQPQTPEVAPQRRPLNSLGGRSLDVWRGGIPDLPATSVRTSTCTEGGRAGSKMPAQGGSPGPWGDPCPDRLGLGNHRNARARVPRPGRPLGRLRTQVRLPARRRWPCPRAARQGSPS